MARQPRQPLAEVFGFPIDNLSPEADRHRALRLCPFNNHAPNCTKDKLNDPLGVCSVNHAGDVVITCPVRFRQEWLIAEDAATFFFPPDASWTSLPEVRLHDKRGKVAGNVDLVLVQYDAQGKVQDFGALEVQAVYISGTIRTAFDRYIADPHGQAHMDWSGERNYPRPDFLSSSRKRLVPQLMYKGGILHTWAKRQAVAVDRSFFATLPTLQIVPIEQAEIAWFVYDLIFNAAENGYKLTRVQTVYTAFSTALQQISATDAPPLQDFIQELQGRLNLKRTRSETASPLSLEEALNPSEPPVDPDQV